jgi:hypothetical protein
MTRTFATLLLLSVAVAGCSKSASEQAPTPAPTPTPAVAPMPKLDSTLQSALAKDIDQVRQSGKWNELRQRWQGQHVTWDVTRFELLCRSEGRCNVAAFPIEKQAKEGWMPELSLSKDEYGKIAAACGADSCRLKIDGTIAEVRGSDAQPPSLRIADVKVVSASRG